MSAASKASDPKAMEARVALINKPEENKFANNSISTAKYNVITFIPLTLFEQFRRVANMYFLVMSLLMLLGTLYPVLWNSPIGYESTFGPLCFVLLATMVSCKNLIYINNKISLCIMTLRFFVDEGGS